MRNKKLIAYAILAVCLEKLLSHALLSDDTRTIWVDYKNHTVALCENGHDYLPRTLTTTRDILLGWILGWLKESNIVILYDCSDNREIALHRPNDFTEPLSPDMLEDSHIPELKHILYIAED